MYLYVCDKEKTSLKEIFGMKAATLGGPTQPAKPSRVVLRGNPTKSDARMSEHNRVNGAS
jgi:hypothetical protein